MNFNTISKKITLRKKIIISAVLLPLIMVGIMLFAVFPTINDIQKIRKAIEAQRIDLEVKYERGQSLKKLSENLKIIEPQLSELEEIFISEDEVLEFITTLEEIAGNNDITQTINLISSKSSAKNGHKKIPLRITASGDFVGQLNYLTELESLNYYINIKSLELTSVSRSSAPKTETKSSHINMIIDADTYWR